MTRHRTKAHLKRPKTDRTGKRLISEVIVLSRAAWSGNGRVNTRRDDNDPRWRGADAANHLGLGEPRRIGPRASTGVSTYKHRRATRRCRPKITLIGTQGLLPSRSAMRWQNHNRARLLLLKLELELTQTHMTQKPMLRIEVGACRFGQQTSKTKRQ